MKKRILIFGILCLLALRAGAQSISATPGFTPLPRPTPSTNWQAVNMRTWDQMQKILLDVSSGKITKAQAATLWSQWSAVIDKEKTLITQSGASDFSASDMTQLKSMMDSLDAAIP